MFRGVEVGLLFLSGLRRLLVAICRALPPEAGGAGAGCGGMSFVSTGAAGVETVAGCAGAWPAVVEVKTDLAGVARHCWKGLRVLSCGMWTAVAAVLERAFGARRTG